MAEHTAKHPNRAEAIAAYPERFPMSVPGPMDDTVAVVDDLRESGVRLLALTNWSAELFRTVRHRLTFLDDFEGVVVSGDEGLAKPDPALFQVVVDRYGVVPEVHRVRRRRAAQRRRRRGTRLPGAPVHRRGHPAAHLVGEGLLPAPA